MTLWPSIDEERAHYLRYRAKAWREDGLLTAEEEKAWAPQLETPWRSNGFWASIVFFILTTIGVMALFGFFWIFKAKPLAGFIAVGLGEVLIRKRWFGTGVESALWLGGLFALIASLPSQGKIEALLVFAAAAAIAGLRVRNPLFGALAAGLVVQYAESKRDLGLLVALIFAAIAILALFRTWRRPSNEWLFIALAVTMPILAYIEADARWRQVTIGLFALFGVFALICGIARRHHAMLVAALIGIAVAITEASRLVEMLLEVKLLLAGGMLLLIAFTLSRALRDRQLGWVITPTRLTNADEALAIAATLAHAPGQREDAPPAGRAQGEGGFGGAGATGGWEGGS